MYLELTPLFGRRNGSWGFWFTFGFVLWWGYSGLSIKKKGAGWGSCRACDISQRPYLKYSMGNYEVLKGYAIDKVIKQTKKSAFSFQKLTALRGKYDPQNTVCSWKRWQGLPHINKVNQYEVGLPFKVRLRDVSCLGLSFSLNALFLALLLKPWSLSIWNKLSFKEKNTLNIARSGFNMSYYTSVNVFNSYKQFAFQTAMWAMVKNWTLNAGLTYTWEAAGVRLSSWNQYLI